MDEQPLTKLIRVARKAQQAQDQATAAAKDTAAKVAASQAANGH